MIGILLMLAGGMALSAFFSGSETGFYRATRIRLVFDSRQGDWTARGLLWLTNNPTLFVAGVLIGNNIANYLTSLALVLVVQRMFENSHIAELAAPIILSPILYIYGESLPKYLYFHKPNLLLKRSGPLLLLFTFLFLPVSCLLWGFGWVLARVLGESPARVRLRLARRELAQVIEEGHVAGILRPAQRGLAQGLFAVANQSLIRFATPMARAVIVKKGAPVGDVLRLARRHKTATVAVSEGTQREPIGYIRVAEIRLSGAITVDEVRPLLTISQRETPVVALMRMQHEGESLACIVDERGREIGLVDDRTLAAPLFRDE